MGNGDHEGINKPAPRVVAEHSRDMMIHRQIARSRSQTGVASAYTRPPKAPGMVSAERARDEMIRKMTRSHH
jgi:hypothetical protein